MHFKPSKLNLRLAITLAVASTLISQQIVFAAPAAATSASPVAKYPTAFTIPTSQKEAIHIVTDAESRPVESYFIHGGSNEDISRFDADLAIVVNANAQLGMGRETEKFKAWYTTNKTQLLLGRKTLPFGNLQGFFFSSFIQYQDEVHAKDVSSASGQGSIVMQISATALLITGFGYGIVKALGTTIKGAMISGPEAGVVGALVDPLVRPLRENAAIAGNKMFGKMGNRINEWFANRSRTRALRELQKMSAVLTVAEGKARNANLIMGRGTYSLTPDQVAANLKRFQTVWGEVYQTWSSVNNSIFKDGRSLTTDLLTNRPLMFSDLLMGSVSGAELLHQGIEDNIDRIILRTGKEATVIESSVDAMIAALDAREHTDVKDPAAAQTAFEASRQALLDLGASPRYVDRIVDQRRQELVFAKQTVGTLVANLVHDFMYEEFNRSLPPSIKEAQQILRSNYVLDFYHHELGVAVNKVADMINFQLRATRVTIDGMTELANDKTTVFSPVKDIQEPNERRSTVRRKLDQLREHTMDLVGHVRRGFTGETCQDLFHSIK